jgi:hypothetical protein
LILVGSGGGALAQHPHDRARARISELGGKIFQGPEDGISVSLAETPVRDVDLEVLQDLPQLRVLYLEKTELTDAALPFLKPLSNLREVYLEDTNVTPQGIQALKDARPGLLVTYRAKARFRPAKLAGLLILFPLLAVGSWLIWAGIAKPGLTSRLRGRAIGLGILLVVVCALLSLIAVLQAFGWDITVSTLFGTTVGSR